MARGFYAENRRVANGRAKRVLGWSHTITLAGMVQEMVASDVAELKQNA